MTTSTRLREQIDLDTLSAELLTVAKQTMQPTQVSLWLRPPVSRVRISAADVSVAPAGGRRSAAGRAGA